MKELIAAELCVTVNTDDSPFFGGYMNRASTVPKYQ